MEFDEWEPVYERILADFGFPRAADENARDVAATFASAVDFETLQQELGLAQSNTTQPNTATDWSVVIVGDAPSLQAELDDFEFETVDAVFAASSAASTLRDHAYQIDCIVTDLDGKPSLAAKQSRGGTVVVVHAHGDNIEAIERWLPKFHAANTVVTTQAAPVDDVYNFGGFTDGDRAAFFGDELGATELQFLGWDFDDPTVGPMKAKKLDWAERLLHWLERRRGDRFEVLNGRRDGIDSIDGTN